MNASKVPNLISTVTKRCVLVAALVAASVLPLAPAASATDRPPTATPVRPTGFETAKVITLTFDAGSDDGDVASILATLEANNIKAAFGLTGRFVEQFPASSKAIQAAGHTIFNHSYSHPDFTTLTQAQRFAELDKAEAAFRAAGITWARWFRAPFKAGYASDSLARDLALKGYYVNFDWTYDTTGYKGSSTSTILSRVRTYTQPGTIFLGHVGGASTDAEALPSVIRTLRDEMGYRFSDASRTLTQGAIRAHYDAKRFLGAPRTLEMAAGSTGRVQWFDKGRIYSSSTTGAREVHGKILAKYVQHKDTAGVLGFPTTAQQTTADTIGRYNRFQRGSIYWTSALGAHEVHGAIHRTWAGLGYERSSLGYPITDEYATATGRRSDFQHGSILWNATTGAVTVVRT